MIWVIFATQFTAIFSPNNFPKSFSLASFRPILTLERGTDQVLPESQNGEQEDHE